MPQRTLEGDIGQTRKNFSEYHYNYYINQRVEKSRIHIAFQRVGSFLLLDMKSGRSLQKDTLENVSRPVILHVE